MVKNAELNFTTIVNNEDFVVRDHRVHDTRIMPGVTFIDIVYRLLKSKGFPVNRLELRNIVFQEPVATSESFDRKVRVNFRQTGDQWIVTARSQKISGGKVISSQWSENFSAEIYRPKNRPVPKSIDIRKLTGEAAQVHDLDVTYAFAREMQIHHYEFMKGLGRIYQGPDYLLAEVWLSDLAKGYLPHFYLHPAYLDSATLAPGIYFFEGGEGISQAIDKPFIPIYISAFQAFESLGEKCYILVPKPEKSLAISGDIKYVNIEIYNDNGRLAARFEKLAAKQIRSKELIHKLINEAAQPTPANESKNLVPPVKPGPEPAAFIVENNQEPLSGKIAGEIRQMIAAIQRKPASEISLDLGYYDQGLDSGNLLQLVRDLERKLGRQLYPTLLFEYTNIRDLAEYLAGKFGDTGDTYTSGETSGIKPEASTEARLETLYYAPHWEPQELDAGIPFSSQENFLIFENEGRIAARFRNIFSGQGHRVIEVRPGKVYEETGDGDFTINPANPDDYRRMLTVLRQRESIPTKIIHHWAGSHGGDDAQAFNAELQWGFYAVVHLSQALMEQKPYHDIRLLYIYPFSSKEQPWPVGPLHAGLRGLARTIRRENPKFIYQTLEFEPAMDIEDLANMLIQEFQIQGLDDEVRFQSGKRFILCYQPVVPEPDTPSLLKEKGVYLITGGAGGLGLIFARHLAQKVQARLVLVGRSVLSPEQQAKFKELEALGSEALYIQADIAQRPAVDKLIAQVKTHFGRIDGVIHAAGITRDSVLLNKTTAEMKEVLAVKVFGTIHLDQALQQDDLDFFAVFSSSSAVTGNVGQADYAYANRFMDNYMEFREMEKNHGRRPGKSIAINWPLWRDGGMKVDAQTEMVLRDKMGMVPLSAEAGFLAFEKALEGDYPQLMVIAGEADRIHQFMKETGIETNPENTEIEATDTPLSPEKAAPESHPSTGEIAIIGVAGRYPMARNLAEFWGNLKSGRDCITEIPEDRWDYHLYFDPDKEKVGTSYSKWGGFIGDVDKFDPLFFNISPREAEFMDPQERIFLETVWETLEDAGYTRAELARERVGVFVGVMWGQYQLFETEVDGRTIAPMVTYASIANRVSYFCNFDGPSLAVDTMCSSSLTSIHLACESIRRGECRTAIAGGVSLSLHPNKYTILSKAKMFSSDGRCRSFGEGGDGYVPGEGSGAVLLKPLNQALVDHDHIYAVIKGSSLNHGGKTSGYSVPNPNAQADVIEETLFKTGIDSRTVNYIEAHGTGTSLGDPIEILGLVKAFGQEPGSGQYCAIGSVKSNIGHLESAAGIVGVTKILLQMKYGQLVPSLHSGELNTKIDFSHTPFRVQQQLEEWKPVVIRENGQERTVPRRAGISSFGAGGSNAHIILEEFIDSRVRSEQEDTRPELILLSARNEDRLAAVAGRMLDFLNTGPEVALADMGFTLRRGREAMAERLAIIAVSRNDLIQKLAGYLQNSPSFDGVYRGIALESASMKASKSNAGFDNLHAIARQWCEGREIDWNWFDDVYGRGQNPVRISLPSYPFARERYWVTDSSSPKLFNPDRHTRIGIGMGTRLHPLIDENISTFEEEAFRKTLRVSELVVKDHIVAGQMILPGAAHVEMARAAGEIAGKRQVNSIQGIEWLRPVILPGKEREVFISLFPETPVLVDYEIYTFEGQAKNICSRGKLDFGQPEFQLETGEMAPLDIEAIVQRCPHRMEKTEIYPLLKKAGFHYGPGFQVTETLWYGSREALVKLRLPEQFQKDLPPYQLHPALLDGAFRSILGFGIDDLAKQTTPYIPFTLRKLEIIQPLTGACYAYAVAESGELRGETAQFQMVIANENGAPLARISGFSVRAFKKPESKKALETGDSELLYYYPAWDREPLASRVDYETIHDTLLIFDREGMEKSCPDSVFAKKFQRMVRIRPGTEYQQKSEQLYYINPEQPGDYQRLFQSLRQYQIQSDHLIHLWNLPVPNKAGSKMKTGEDPLENGLYSVLYIFNSLTAIQPGVKCKILLAFNDQPGENTGNSNDDIYGSYFEAIYGFARSTTPVNPGFQMECMRLTAKDFTSKAINQWLAVEICAPEFAHGAVVRYTKEGRMVRRLHSLKELDAMAPVPFRNQGVYLITGGTGGLGMIVAQYLAEKYQARLILTGRSALDKAKQAQIDELEKRGAQVVYYPGDIQKAADAAALVRIGKETFKGFHGVIHCAGVSGRTPVSGAGRTDFAQVLAPKVQGTIQLDQATRDEDLDCFVLFSSIASFLGDFGVCSYASANSFMDSFAHWREQLREKGRRKGMTLSLNWPLWRDGGMGLEGNEEMNALYEYSGMKALNQAEGLQALEAALQAGRPQLVVAYGNREKIDSVLRPNRGQQSHGLIKQAALETIKIPDISEPEVSGESGASGQAMSRFENELLRETEKYLIKILAEVIHLPDSRINSRSPLDSYGVDSVMILELNRRLERDFQSLPKTLFFEYHNLFDLAGFLVKNHPESLQTFFHIAPGLAEESQETPDHKLVSASKPVHSRFVKRPEPGESGTSPLREQEDIAIIGISGRYPMAGNLEEFWENLKQGRNCIEEIPMERWDAGEFYHPQKGMEGKTYSKWGGFIPDVDQFDPLFFNISPRDAEMMDPQERLFLETVWHAVEDSGYTRDTLRRYKTGVFVGVMYGQYQLLGVEETCKGNPQAIGSFFSSIANRVSYYMDFNGPSLAVDTACSSALEAICLACESIYLGNCDLAVAGGVNITLHPSKYLFLSQANLLSSEGLCRSFGEGGDGYVPGEGVGAILLKPLSRALADQDHIYGVIKGFSVNHSGKTSGYTMPNPNAQTRLITDAIRRAKIDPRTISYIEAQATGTSMGDPIEITGLTKAYRPYTQDKQFCAIGSVKTNIGHLESASGVAGIAKILLQFKHQQLVPSLHSDRVNPNIDFANSPFYLQRELTPWPRPEVESFGVKKSFPRRAGINSFGAGGSNVHLILEESPVPLDTTHIMGREPQIIVLSAKTEERLQEYIRRILRFIGPIREDSTDSTVSNPATVRNHIPALENQLLRLAAAIIGVAGAELKAADDLSGSLDQLGLLAWVAQINAEFSLDVTVDIIMEYNSARSLAEYLTTCYPEAILAKYGPATQPKTETAISTMDFASIAYTLQVGREAMEERLAVVADSLDDLSEKLVRYLEGGQPADRLYRGNPANILDQVNHLITGRAKEEFIKIIIGERDYNKLAELWVAGVQIDWNLLHTGHSPKRIPLPVYPFSRERYWIPLSARTAAFRKPVQKRQSTEYGKNIGSEAEMEQVLTKIFADFLKIPANTIKMDENLRKYGFDSLTGMKLIHTLEGIYGLRISIKTIFEAANIRELARYLVKEAANRVWNHDGGGLPAQFNPSENPDPIRNMLLQLNEGAMTPEQALEYRIQLEKSASGGRKP